MMFRIFIVVFLFVSGNAYAELQPPSPRPLKTSQEPQTESRKKYKEPSANNCGSEISPCIVKLLDSPNSHTNTANGTNGTNQESPKDWWIVPDWWVVIFTGGLIIVGMVQACLFIWQLRLFRSSLADTKEVALMQLENLLKSPKEL